MYIHDVLVWLFTQINSHGEILSDAMKMHGKCFLITHSASHSISTLIGMLCLCKDSGSELAQRR